MQNNWPEQMKKEWEELKQEGSGHYKTGEVEPIDLYYSLGILHPFAAGCIIKYATRSATKRPDPADAAKIRHYSKMLDFVGKWGPTPVAAIRQEAQDA